MDFNHKDKKAFLSNENQTLKYIQPKRPHSRSAQKPNNIAGKRPQISLHHKKIYENILYDKQKNINTQ